MQTIKVELHELDVTYPYYWDSELGVTDVSIRFRHIGHGGEQIGSVTEFLNQIAIAMRGELPVNLTIDVIKEQDNDSYQQGLPAKGEEQQMPDVSGDIMA